MTGAAGLAARAARRGWCAVLNHVDRVMVVGLLGPSRLAARVVELESDRGSVVDTAAADLRRIERDLHDGAQARLVALAMDLGLAKEKLLEDPKPRPDGRRSTRRSETRPPGTPRPRPRHPPRHPHRPRTRRRPLRAGRTVHRPVTGHRRPASTRPAQAIEGITYFTVSELLQNITKHAGPTGAPSTSGAPATGSSSRSPTTAKAGGLRPAAVRPATRRRPRRTHRTVDAVDGLLTGCAAGGVIDSADLHLAPASLGPDGRPARTG